MISKLAFLPVLLSFLCALQTQGIYFYPFFFFTKYCIISIFCSVQFSRSVVSDSATPWTTACQASLGIINSQILTKIMSIESVMTSNHLILCCPLLLLPSIFCNIRVFSSESVLCIRRPTDWSFSFSISLPMIIQDRFPL